MGAVDMTALPAGFSVVTMPHSGGDLPPGFSVVQPGGATAAPASAVAQAPAAPMPANAADEVKAAIMRPTITAANPMIGGILAGIDALTGGKATNAVAKIGTNLGKSAMDAATLPGDVLNGKAGQPTFDPMTGQVNQFPDDMVERGANAAGFMLGGETPGGQLRLVTAQGVEVPRKVTGAMTRDQVPLTEVGPRVANLGPAGMVADVGPNAQALAAGIATQPGAASTTVTNALRARQRDATNRVPAAVNDVLGPATPPSAVQADIRDNMRAVSPEYTAALANAGPVDATALAAQLDQVGTEERGPAQTAIQQVRQMLNDTGTPGAEPTLSNSATTLLKTRNAIDGMLREQGDTNVIRVLGDARRQIGDMLTQAVPGIADIDAKYQELARQRDGLETGGNVLDGGKTAVWPQENAAAVVAGVQPQGTLVGPSATTFRLSQGARADIERIVGTKANDRVALAGIMQGEGDWNLQKLGQLFGPDRADAIMQVVNNERQMADTENKALAGSKTAATTAAQADINTPSAPPSALRAAANFRFGDAAFNALDKVSAGRASTQRASANQTIADVIMGRGDWRTVPGAAPMHAPLPIPQRQRKPQDDEVKAAVMRRLN